MKSSFDIGAASSTLHVMNENVRKKTPIYTNKMNTKLASSWPTILALDANTYEKRKCAKKKQAIKKVNKKLQINLLLHLILLTQVVVALVVLLHLTLKLYQV